MTFQNNKKTNGERIENQKGGENFRHPFDYEFLLCAHLVFAHYKKRKSYKKCCKYKNIGGIGGQQLSAFKRVKWNHARFDNGVGIYFKVWKRAVMRVLTTTGLNDEPNAKTRIKITATLIERPNATPEVEIKCDEDVLSWTSGISDLLRAINDKVIKKTTSLYLMRSVRIYGRAKTRAGRQRAIRGELERNHYTIFTSYFTVSHRVSTKRKPLVSLEKPAIPRVFYVVGVPRFELGASWSRTKRATKLRYTPPYSFIIIPNRTLRVNRDYLT